MSGAATPATRCQRTGWFDVFLCQENSLLKPRALRNAGACYNGALGIVISPSTPFLTTGDPVRVAYQEGIEDLGDIGTGQPGMLHLQLKRETLPTRMWVISPTEGLRATVEPLTTCGPAETFRKGVGVQGRTGALGTARRKPDGSLDSLSM